MQLEIRKKGKFIRERLISPDFFDKRSFRTIRSRRGHNLIVGCQNGFYNGREKTCNIGTEAQSLLHPLREYKRFCSQGRCPVLR